MRKEKDRQSILEIGVAFTHDSQNQFWGEKVKKIQNKTSLISHEWGRQRQREYGGTWIEYGEEQEKL